MSGDSLIKRRYIGSFDEPPDLRSYSAGASDDATGSYGDLRVGCDPADQTAFKAGDVDCFAGGGCGIDQGSVEAAVLVAT